MMLRYLVPPLCTVAPFVLASAAALAQPEDDDPLGRLMQERGLINSAAEVSKARLAAATPARHGGRKPSGGPSLVQKARDRGAELVSAAIGFMGSPYQRGGNSVDTGFDCSGFTRHIFQTGLGLVLPRTSREQAKAASLVPVAREELRAGDLVFFNTVGDEFSHVGLYLGNHKFIHAPRTGGLIRVEDLRVNYWAQRFNGGRRAAKLAGLTQAVAASRKAAPAADTPAPGTAGASTAQAAPGGTMPAAATPAIAAPPAASTPLRPAAGTPS